MNVYWNTVLSHLAQDGDSIVQRYFQNDNVLIYSLRLSQLFQELGL